ncbi:MAG: thiamine-phosphate kinase [Gaiellaceae bacterium]|jgi:thiamine-monophosphate kinase
MRLSDLGEFGFLRELERRGLAQRIQNDAARFAPDLVVTQDALIEGIHFRLDWTGWRDLGYKAAAVNISDLAASGAEPEALIVSLGLPGASETDDVIEFYEGIAEAGVPVLGGDTSAADRLYLSVTALGRASRVPGRDGARRGDLLVVSGPLGASAAGFHCLKEGLESPVVRSHLRPPLRVAEGRELAQTAHAMLDISDGLASDALRIAERSGCRLLIELERVPVAAGVAEIARQLDLDVYSLACAFGEDYELLAAVPEPGRFTLIGRCEEGEGVVFLRDGEPVELSGWDHFR